MPCPLIREKGIELFCIDRPAGRKKTNPSPSTAIDFHFRNVDFVLAKLRGGGDIGVPVAEREGSRLIPAKNLLY